VIKHIDTAPVIEAYQAGGECPLCDLLEKTEEGYLEQFLGGSVMEPNMRVIINEKGFCAEHFGKLYGMGNRLGLALMAHTHLKQRIDDIKRRGAKGARHGLINKRDSNPEKTCACCDRLNNTMERYIDTVIYLYDTNGAFREVFMDGRGVCIPHYEKLMARATMEGRVEFAGELHKLELRCLDKLEHDLEWFTLKFDYRNNDKPWADSKDALIRAVRKLSGAKICG